MKGVGDGKSAKTLLPSLTFGTHAQPVLYCVSVCKGVCAYLPCGKLYIGNFNFSVEHASPYKHSSNVSLKSTNACVMPSLELLMQLALGSHTGYFSNWVISAGRLPTF